MVIFHQYTSPTSKFKNVLFKWSEPFNKLPLVKFYSLKNTTLMVKLIIYNNKKGGGFPFGKQSRYSIHNLKGYLILYIPDINQPLVKKAAPI